jgi:hypothetical protein
MKRILVFIATTAAGLVIAYIDSRPTWDDTSVTVFLLILGGGLIGVLVEKRSWLHLLAFGIWIPLYGLIVRHDPLMLIVLLFPLVGFLGGWGLRWLYRKYRRSA